MAKLLSRRRMKLSSRPAPVSPTASLPEQVAGLAADVHWTGDLLISDRRQRTRRIVLQLFLTALALVVAGVAVKGHYDQQHETNTARHGACLQYNAQQLRDRLAQKDLLLTLVDTVVAQSQSSKKPSQQFLDTLFNTYDERVDHDYPLRLCTPAAISEFYNHPPVPTTTTTTRR